MRPERSAGQFPCHDGVLEYIGIEGVEASGRRLRQRVHQERQFLMDPGAQRRARHCHTVVRSF